MESSGSAKSRSDAGNLLRVLMYHRVADPQKTPYLNPRLVSTVPEVFASQMQVLARSYNVVAMDRVLDRVLGGRPLPERAVLITFDDAYADFREFAWPILKRCKLPATLFVPTSYPGREAARFWWDTIYAALHHTSQASIRVAELGELRLRSARERRQSINDLQQHLKTLNHHKAMELVDDVGARLGENRPHGPSVLTWEQLRELAADGVALGAHTRTHPLLTRVSPQEARAEIVESYRDLQRETGTLPIFAYPGGDHNDEVADIVKQEGFKLAFATRGPVNDLRTADPFRLYRTNISRKVSSSLVFRIRLHPWFEPIEQWRQRNSPRLSGGGY